jgi:hypothetical protein
MVKSQDTFDPVASMPPYMPPFSPMKEEAYSRALAANYLYFSKFPVSCS